MASTRTELPLLALLVACGGGKTPEPVEIVGVDVSVAQQMPTVVTVRFQTSAEATGHVEFGIDGTLDRTSRTTASGTDHTVHLAGLPPETEVSYRVVIDDETTDTSTVSTGVLETAGAPTVTGSGMDHYLVQPVVVGNTNVITLIDPEGRITWQWTDNRDVAVYRGRVLKDGSGIVYAATVKGGEPNPDSAIIKVSWDGSKEEVIDVPYLAHDFVQLDDGTLISLAYEYRGDIQGNKLIEIAPDGSTTDLWSAWDCFDPAVHESSDPDHGWIHANALDYDAETDSLLVGMRNLSTIARVDRATGDCVWAFGGSGGDVEITGSKFRHQHQFTWLGDSMLVFDNDGAPGLESRAIEYSFDEGTKTATEIRAFYADPTIFSLILGDVHRMDDGDTVITWAIEGLVERVDANDDRVWTLKAADGAIYGFTELLAEPTRP